MLIIPNKIRALQCSRIRRLYNNSFHEWTLIPHYVTEKSFAAHLNFVQIYSLKVSKPSFSYLSIKKLFCTEKKHLAMMNEIPSCILCWYLWFGANIRVDKTSIQFSRFSEKLISQLFNGKSSIKKWHEFKREYGLHGNSFFECVQLIFQKNRNLLS